MERIITVAEVKMTVIYAKITVTNEKNDSHNAFITVMTVIQKITAQLKVAKENR